MTKTYLYDKIKLEMIMPYYSLNALLALSTSARIYEEYIDFDFDIESYLE